MVFPIFLAPTFQSEDVSFCSDFQVQMPVWSSCPLPNTTKFDFTLRYKFIFHFLLVVKPFSSLHTHCKLKCVLRGVLASGKVFTRALSWVTEQFQDTSSPLLTKWIHLPNTTWWWYCSLPHTLTPWFDPGFTPFAPSSLKSYFQFCVRCQKMQTRHPKLINSLSF